MRVRKELNKEEYEKNFSNIPAQLNIGNKYEIEYELNESSGEKERRILKNIINYLEKHKENPMYGIGTDYDYNGKYIIACNWNCINQKLVNYIENCDFITLEWDDECVYCSECSKIIRITPDYYGDQKNFIEAECEILCRECVEDNPEWLLDTYINNNNKAVPDWGLSIIKAAGFVCLEEDEKYCEIFENGFYPGQNDNPETIINNLNKEFGFNITERYDTIWYLNNVGQFDVHFSLFIREK